MRWPSTGVLGALPFFKMPQPLAARARRSGVKGGKTGFWSCSVLLGLGRERGARIDAERPGDLDGAGTDGFGNCWILGDRRVKLAGFRPLALLDHRQRSHFAGRSEPRLAALGERREARNDLVAA